MMRIAALLAVLAAAFALFYVSARTPAPAPANAAFGDFSAGRAMRDIAVIGAVPHPVGSPANAAVRDYVVRRMTELGLSPRVQSDEGVRGDTYWGERWIGGAKVDNVIGVLRGRDPTLPALALMAHHDTVPGSPGAADDTAGVASALEVARAIEAGGQPLRPIDSRAIPDYGLMITVDRADLARGLVADGRLRFSCRATTPLAIAGWQRAGLAGRTVAPAEPTLPLFELRARASDGTLLLAGF